MRYEFASDYADLHSSYNYLKWLEVKRRQALQKRCRHVRELRGQAEYTAAPSISQAAQKEVL